MINIFQPREDFIIEYPQALTYLDKQEEIDWTHHEYDLNNDVHDILTKTSKSESIAITRRQMLFTLYETKIGNEYWSDFVAKIFNRPGDIQRVARYFSKMESCVHAPSYFKLTELLHLDTEEFCNEYKEIDVLRNRMNWIGKQTNDKGDYFSRLKSLAVFSMIEGVVLYSSFAFFKHFQSQGKNIIPNFVSIIDKSVDDEQIHSSFGAYLYKTVLNEVLLEEPNFDLIKLQNEIKEVAEKIVEHEEIIINFANPDNNISHYDNKDDLIFVKSRVNLCLNQLNISPIYTITENKIADWFYKDINSSTLHDFFSKSGSEYSRKWKKLNFIWQTRNVTNDIDLSAV